jgi:MFS family permease
VEAVGITQYTWRWMLGSEIIPALFWFGLLFTIPESPRWLVFNGHPERARDVMKRVMPENRIAAEIEEMESSMHLAHDSHSVGQQLKELFTRRMRLVLVVGVAIAAVQPLTGINAVLFYAPTIFETLGIGTDAAFQQAVWVGLVSIVATGLALLVIDRVGRRPILIWGLTWLVCSLLICAWGFKQATYTLSEPSLVELQEQIDTEGLKPLVGATYDSDTEFKAALHEAIGEDRTRDEANLIYQKAAKLSPALILFGIMSFIAAFQFSVGPVMWVLFSEIFPIALRGIAIPAFAFITSILSYFVQQFFPWQLTVMGASAIFVSYAVMAAIGLAVLFFKLPETKNKSIEEIERMFTGAREPIREGSTSTH